MKKLAIAGASAVLAAMPVVGVFAASGNSFTDSLEVNVIGGCTLEEDGGTAGDYSHNDREFSAVNVTPGSTVYLNATDATTGPSGGHVTISCNTSDSSKVWTVDVAVTGLTSGANTIGGSAATSGATSGWAIKSNATGTTASNPFANYRAAASETFLTGTAAAVSNDNHVTFNPSYQVYVAPSQPAGTYEGTAVYTITLP